MIALTHTTRPRKAAAGTRRHHRKSLAWRLRCLLPGADTVTVTPAMWVDASGDPRAVYSLHATTADGSAIAHDGDTTHAVVAALQGAWPNANWRTAQTWQADTNTLTAHHGDAA